MAKRTFKGAVHSFYYRFFHDSEVLFPSLIFFLLAFFVLFIVKSSIHDPSFQEGSLEDQLATLEQTSDLTPEQSKLLAYDEYLASKNLQPEHVVLLEGDAPYQGIKISEFSFFRVFPWVAPLTGMFSCFLSWAYFYGKEAAGFHRNLQRGGKGKSELNFLFSYLLLLLPWFLLLAFLSLFFCPKKVFLAVNGGNVAEANFAAVFFPALAESYVLSCALSLLSLCLGAWLKGKSKYAFFVVPLSVLLCLPFGFAFAFPDSVARFFLGNLQSFAYPANPWRGFLPYGIGVISIAIEIALTLWGWKKKKLSDVPCE